MDEKIIITPSGYKVTLASFLTFGQKRQLMNLIYSKLRITPSQDPNKQAQVADFSVDFIQTIQDEAFTMLVKSIEVKDVLIKEDLYSVVLGWREEDGQCVFDEIDRIANVLGNKTAAQTEGEKKEA